MSFRFSTLTPIQKRRLYLGLAAAIMFVTAYVLYWKATADQLQKRVDAWAAQERAAGAQLSYDPTRITGFPFSVDLDAANIAFSRADVFRFTAPQLRLHIRPWAPFRPTLIGQQKSTLVFPRENTSHSLDAFNIRIVRPWITPHSYRDTGLYLYVNLDGLVLDPSIKAPLGNTIPHIGFNAKVMGEVPDILRRDSVEAWRVSGGIVNLSKLDLQWPPIALKGEGTVTVDKTLQPLGALNATLSGYKETVDMFRDQGQIKPFAASLFKAALSLLEDKKQKDGAPRTITAPVTVQNNGLFIAGINLAIWQPLSLPFTEAVPNPAPAPQPAAAGPAPDNIPMLIGPAPAQQPVAPPAP